jgi:diguanylate cyclase (GGDEF)-like protein/PAS domain S-box-containing protein
MVHGNQTLAAHNGPPLTNDSLQQLREVLEACDVGLCLVDEQRRVWAWNQRLAERALSWDADSPILIDTLFPALANDRFTHQVRAAVRLTLAPGQEPARGRGIYSRQVIQLDEQTRVRVSVRPLMSYPGYCLVQLMDLDDTQPDKGGHPELTLTEQRTRAMLASIEDAVILLDPEGIVEFVNLAAESLTGYQSLWAVGRPLTAIYQVYDEAGSLDQPFEIEQVLSDMGRQLVLQHREGFSIPIQQTLSRLRDSSGNLEGMVLVFKDTSQSRKMAAQLSWQSSHDPVTRLYNRAEFDRYLSQLLDQTENQGDCHCLLYLDVDRFIVVNDNCGHAAGDELLRQLAGLMKRSIRSSDMLARLGGDEFGIVLRRCTHESAMRIAESIRANVQDFSFSWREKSFPQSISIGMVPINTQSVSLQQVLSSADMACIAAKEEGRNKIHIYHPHEGSAAKRHGETQWVTRIRHALEADLLVLYVQPIASLNPGRGAREHVEVLIRLSDQEGNLIVPGVFIPAAERFGLMPLVDRWVVARVVRFIVENREACLSSGRRFFVNLSGLSLCDEVFLQWLLELLQSQDVPRGMLCFELTETAAIANLALAEHFMCSLQRIGCEFALDDFGSGLSSFAYLKHLPVEYLKIDGVFVKDMLESDIDESMVDAINHIGHVMGLETVAEFVESAQIRDRLMELGVDYVQGYGICRPFPISELLAR